MDQKYYNFILQKVALINL